MLFNMPLGLATMNRCTCKSVLDTYNHNSGIIFCRMESTVYGLSLGCNAVPSMHFCSLFIESAELLVFLAVCMCVYSELLCYH